jgi:predicted aminopeptidase
MLALCRCLCCLLLSASLTGCGLPYYWQAVGGQLELLRKRTPTVELLADPGVDPDLKAVLSDAVSIRRFAVQELLLPDNKSYTTYVDLQRPYVVWNVIAAEEFSIEPQRWCFPFAGCVAYRGYFDKAAAEDFEAGLAQQGFDTYSGGASAYSTLGYFADPILNTMVEGGQEYIAALLFHELAHQRLYVKSDSEFNEAFATAVEEYGMEVWLRRTRDEAALRRYRDRMSRRNEFGELVARQRARLAEIYAGPEDAAAMRAAKQAAFGLMRQEYETLKASWGGSSEYDGWFERSLNNASLAAVATYRQWLPVLRAELDALGVESFYAQMDRLAELSLSEREAWLAARGTGLSAASVFPES